MEPLRLRAGFQALTGHRWLLAPLLDSTDLEGRKDERKRATQVKVRHVHSTDRTGPGLPASASPQAPVTSHSGPSGKKHSFSKHSKAEL